MAKKLIKYKRVNKLLLVAVQVDTLTPKLKIMLELSFFQNKHKIKKY
jgi:hypothetical protein